MKIHYLLLFGLFLLSCGSDDDTMQVNPPNQEEFYFPPIESNEWETTAIAELDWNEDAMDELFFFLEDTNTEAFMVLVNGRIVIEQYFNGENQSSIHPWFSAGKTLTAFTVGLAQQDGFLTINDKTSDYLGDGWTNMTQEKEDLVTIWHQLTMTSGGNYNLGNWNCTDPECLNYLADAGDNWFYYNAFYSLIQPVLNGAIPQGFDAYFNDNLRNKVGMRGFWFDSGFNRWYVSDARSMARFGILNLREGNWAGDQLINESYYNAMVSSSQELNPAYGYLWWLNGTNEFRVPASEELFTGELIINAPSDLFAGLGAQDQKMYIIPSKNMVVIRLGGDGGSSSLASSSYDNALWEKLNEVIE